MMLGLLILTLAVSGVSGRAQSLEQVVLQFDGAMSFGKAGYFMAIEKGFYADEGLEVEIRVGEQPGQVTEKLVSGQAHFGNMPSTALLEYLAGQPLVVVSAIHQNTGYGLVVRHDSNIATPQDLVGKTIVASGGAQVHEILAMLHDVGVEPDQVNLLKHKIDIQADRRADYLIHQRAHAIMVRIVPHALAPFVEEGLPVRSFKPASYGIHFYQNLTVTTRDFLDQNPQTVAAFRRATLKGWRHAITHPSETIDVYTKRYVPLYPKLDNPPDVMANQAISHFERVGVDEIGAMNPQRWRQIANAYHRMGMAESKRPLDDFIYDPTPSQAWVGWTLSFGAGAIVLAIGALLWNRQLKRRVAERTDSLQRSEQRQLLMMQELDHRVKNNLAAILSLSHQTLNASDSLTQFSDVFSGRLAAMAGTHEALAKSRWQGVELDKTIRLALRRVIAQHPDAIQIQGARLTLPALAVIPVSLALHELGANAIQHGALTAPNGKVHLDWQTLPDGNLEITWNESGGPTPTPAPFGVGLNLVQG
jgi:ABC-type nitrate/sulfonate/bicarbonate transport system substrate-binding protein/two-component sensor histidine kinase